jgi:hypothetical protein
MQEGRTYTVDTGSLARNGTHWTLKFDMAHARSEAVHVNTLGYVLGAPEKYCLPLPLDGRRSVVYPWHFPRT